MYRLNTKAMDKDDSNTKNIDIDIDKDKELLTRKGKYSSINLVSSISLTSLITYAYIEGVCGPCALPLVPLKVIKVYHAT